MQHNRGKKRAWQRWLGMLILAATLAGCDATRDWRTADINDKMPPLDFTLTAENGQTVSAGDYAGQPVLVFFGYTHCPDVCPITMARLASIMRQLEPAEREDVQVLFVSVDPARDTPDVLKAYTEAFNPRFTGLTGSREQIDTVTNRYRVTYRYGDKDADGDYTVTHFSAVLAFARDGEPAFLARNTDSDAALISDLRILLDQSG